MSVPAIVASDKFNKDCAKLLGNLSDYAAENAETKRTPLALIGAGGFFRSAFNQRYRPLQPQVFGDKIRTVELSYLKRSAASTDPAAVDLCSPEATSVYDTVNVAFDNSVRAVGKVVITLDEWAKTCEDRDSGMMRRIYAEIDQMLRTLDTALIRQIIVGAGGNAAEASPAAGQVRALANILSAEGLINANVFFQLEEDLLENEIEMGEGVALFGYRNPLRRIESIRQFGCCNDKGVDQDAIASSVGFAPFRSRTVDTAFAAEIAAQTTANAGGLDDATDPHLHALLMWPGAAHLLEYYRYQHAGFRHGASYGELFTDPFSGEQMDMKVHFIDCDSSDDGREKIVISFFAEKQVFTMPTDQYAAGDHLATTNGIHLYKLTQAS